MREGSAEDTKGGWTRDMLVALVSNGERKSNVGGDRDAQRDRADDWGVHECAVGDALRKQSRYED